MANPEQDAPETLVKGDIVDSHGDKYVYVYILDNKKMFVPARKDGLPDHRYYPFCLPDGYRKVSKSS